MHLWVLLLAAAAGQAACWAPCPGAATLPTSGRSLAAVPGSCRAAPRGLELRMDMLKRIGRVAKDKAAGAKDWVDSGASADKDVNVRGAASGAVIGVSRPALHCRAQG